MESAEPRSFRVDWSISVTFLPLPLHSMNLILMEPKQIKTDLFSVISSPFSSEPPVSGPILVRRRLAKRKRRFAINRLLEETNNRRAAARTSHIPIPSGHPYCHSNLIPNSKYQPTSPLGRPYILANWRQEIPIHDYIGPMGQME